MEQLHLAVALRASADDARAALTARWWEEQVAEAEAGLLDFVTLDDVLDPVLLSARLALRTTHVGLVPSVVATHSEPFHVSTAIATLDHASRGRAGVAVRVDADPGSARLFGRRPELEQAVESPGEGALHAEAADHVEVQRRLWDSWEDDAEIRDVATGRFVDRERLHYIDFEGEWFGVRGPSITPRPPQGQPPVLVAVRDQHSARLAGAAADVVVLHPDAPVGADDLRGRPRRPVVLGDVGVPAEADDLLARRRTSGVDGFLLHAERPDDLRAITRGLVPELQRRGAFRTSYAETTLRGRLGLERPASRYAEASATSAASGARA